MWIITAAWLALFGILGAIANYPKPLGGAVVGVLLGPLGVALAVWSGVKLRKAQRLTQAPH